MDNPKLRRLLILAHLFTASLLAPMFLMLAVSGGLYLIGNKGKVETSPVPLAASAALDFKSATLEADVRALLKDNNIAHEFEYIKNRGSLIELRPTSRTYLKLTNTDAGLEATRNKPNLQKSMIELHKGHGPKLFKTYQKIVAIGLFGVVFGGLFVGLLAKAYRRKTLITTGLGVILFLLLALFA